MTVILINKYGGTRSVQDRQCTYNVTLRCFRVTIVPLEKQLITTYYERVCVASDNQCEMSMLPVVTCRVSGSTIIFRITSKMARFLKIQAIEHKMCFLFPLQSFPENFLFLRRTERDIIIKVYWSSCDVPVILVRL